MLLCTLINICIGLPPDQFQINLSYNVPDEVYQEDIVLLELNESSNPRLIIELKPVVSQELGRIPIKDIRETLLYANYSIRKCKLNKLVVCL